MASRYKPATLMLWLGEWVQRHTQAGAICSASRRWNCPSRKMKVTCSIDSVAAQAQPHDRGKWEATRPALRQAYRQAPTLIVCQRRDSPQSLPTVSDKRLIVATRAPMISMRPRSSINGVVAMRYALQAFCARVSVARERTGIFACKRR
ncbi:hypothetical protein P3T22_002354 [Paraburkholderia sp. GAS348]